MTDKLWKAIERKVADFFGGTRVPITGRQRGSAPDVSHVLFSFEIKHRKLLPGWLFDAMNQAEESRKENQIALVVLHQKGMTISESLAVLRVSDVRRLYMRIQDLEDEVEETRTVLRFTEGV